MVLHQVNFFNRIWTFQRAHFQVVSFLNGPIQISRNFRFLNVQNYFVLTSRFYINLNIDGHLKMSNKDVCVCGIESQSWILKVWGFVIFFKNRHAKFSFVANSDKHPV
jgi:hypothetical protein